jgi:TetR/AcrR family transcriptional regulator, cholesterol catabolism regulator
MANDIRRAAVRLFALHGYNGVGIRQIGREVGLNSATLYHYCGSKEGLLVDIMTSGMQAQLRAGRDAIEYSAEPQIQLIRLVRAHVELNAVYPLTSQVIDGEIRALSAAARKAIVELRDDYEAMFQRVLDRGARIGVFQLSDVKMTRLALLEMCSGVSRWYRQDGDVSVAELKDHFARLACLMVGLRGSTQIDAGSDVDVHGTDFEPGEGHRATGELAG